MILLKKLLGVFVLLVMPFYLWGQKVTIGTIDPGAGNAAGGNATNAQPPNPALTNLANNNFTTISNTSILYVTIDGNDSTAKKGRLDKPWLTITGAVANASSGDKIELGPGTFVLVDSVIVPTNVMIYGQGPQHTYIADEAFAAPDALFKLSKDSGLQGLKIFGAQPVGVSATSITNAVIDSCELYGITDCISVASTNVGRILWVKNSYISSGWDSFVVDLNKTNAYVRVDNSIFYLDTTLDTPGANVDRLLNAFSLNTGGGIEVNNCSITATNGLNVKLFTVSEASGAIYSWIKVGNLASFLSSTNGGIVTPYFFSRNGSNSFVYYENVSALTIITNAAITTNQLGPVNLRLTSTDARTNWLPDIGNLGKVRANNLVLGVEDGAGNANSANITVRTLNGATIDGATSYLITNANGSVRFKSIGTNWTVISSGNIFDGNTGSGGSPGGAEPMLQINLAGVFRGTTNLTYNPTNNILMGASSAGGDFKFQVRDGGAPNATNELGPKYLRLRNGYDLGIGNNDTNNWEFRTTKHFEPETDNINNVGNPALRVANVYARNLNPNVVSNYLFNAPGAASTVTIYGSNQLWQVNVTSNITFADSALESNIVYQVRLTNNTSTLTYPGTWRWWDGATLASSPLMQQGSYVFELWKDDRGTNASVKVGPIFLVAPGLNFNNSTNSGTGVITQGVDTDAEFNGLTVSNNIGYVVTTLTGVDGANTNFTFIASQTNVVYISGQTNVNFKAIMGYSASVAYRGTIIITNRTATARTLSLGTITNNWINLQKYDGITAPYTLTNSQAVRFTYEILGTNVQYALKPMDLPSN